MCQMVFDILPLSRLGSTDVQVLRRILQLDPDTADPENTFGPVGPSEMSHTQLHCKLHYC